MAKNGISTLDLYDFPPRLKNLQLDGNDIATLKGAVLPDALESLYVVVTVTRTRRLGSRVGTCLSLQPSSPLTTGGNVWWQLLYELPDHSDRRRAVPVDAPEVVSSERPSSCLVSLVLVPSSMCSRLPSFLSMYVASSLVSGATVTTFIARESDVAVLAGAQLSFTSTVSTDCPKGGKWAETAKVCAMPGARTVLYSLSLSLSVCGLRPLPSPSSRVDVSLPRLQPL